MAINPNRTKLDQNAILQRSFDESSDRLRVDAQVSASIGTVECIISASSGDNIAISDGTNELKVNSDGSINTISAKKQTKILFNEVTSIVSGVTTTLISFIPSTDINISSIDTSGSNIGIYEVLIDSNLIDKKYTYFGNSLNCNFDMKDFLVESGKQVRINVVHNRPYTGNFNASLKYSEV